MAAELLITPSRALDMNADPYDGAKWFFYITGTTTLQAVYKTATLAIAHANPVVADAGGKFPNVYLDATKIYRGVCKNKDESVVLHDIDPINTGALAQLSLNAGASAIGTSTGETVEQRLAALDTLTNDINSGTVGTATEQAVQATATSRLERMYPPFAQIATVPMSDVLPTAAQPLAAKRLHADWFVARVRTTALAGATADDIYWDEFFFRNPRGYSEVASGWQLAGHRAYYNGKYSTFMISTDDQGGMPNPDFAIRLGLFASPYHSGGEGPAYFYTGFGHGRAFVDDATISLVKDGGGPNLNLIANWPVGAVIKGSSLSIETPFKLRTLAATLPGNPLATTNGSGTLTINHNAHGFTTGQFVKIESIDLAPGLNGLTYQQLIGRKAITVVNANSYTIATGGTATATGNGGGSNVQIFPDVVNLTYYQDIGTFGLRRKGAYSASIAGYGIQDSYGYMFPVNPYDVTHFKPDGLPAVALVQDNQQKGNWTTQTSIYHQAYNSARPNIVARIYLEYGQPLRKAAGGLAAWAQNRFGRYFFRDLGDYAKYYVFINSSEEGTPRTAFPLTVGEVFEWQSVLCTEYRATGPR